MTVRRADVCRSFSLEFVQNWFFSPSPALMKTLENSSGNWQQFTLRPDVCTPTTFVPGERDPLEHIDLRPSSTTRLVVVCTSPQTLQADSKWPLVWVNFGVSSVCCPFESSPGRRRTPSLQINRRSAVGPVAEICAHIGPSAGAPANSGQNLSSCTICDEVYTCNISRTQTKSSRARQSGRGKRAAAGGKQWRPASLGRSPLSTCSCRVRPTNHRPRAQSSIARLTTSLIAQIESNCSPLVRPGGQSCLGLILYCARVPRCAAEPMGQTTPLGRPNPHLFLSCH